MFLDVVAILVLFIAAIGMAFALNALMRSAAWRSTLPNSTTVASRLESIAPARQAQLIFARPRAATIRAMPVLLLACALIWIPLKHQLTGYQCSVIFETNQLLVSLLFLTYGLPIFIAFVSMLGVSVGCKVLKHGYYPPLDSARFSDTIATKGFLSRVRGWMLVALPLFAFYLAFHGHQTYNELLDGRSTAEIRTALTQDCGSQ